MPKSTKVTKKDGVIHRQKVSMKMRIGPRKSGTSALAMSTEELLAVLEVSDKSKWHQKARTVLVSRGVA